MLIGIGVLILVGVLVGTPVFLARDLLFGERKQAAQPPIPVAVAVDVRRSTPQIDADPAARRDKEAERKTLPLPKSVYDTVKLPPALDVPPLDIPPSPEKAPPLPKAVPATPVTKEESVAVKPVIQPAPEPESATALVVKRRSDLSDDELRKQLLTGVREVNLGSDLSRKALVMANFNQHPAPQFALQLGLPVPNVVDCLLGKEPAATLQALSRRLRDHLSQATPTGLGDPRPDPDRLRQLLLHSPERSQWLQPEAIPTLLQMLMAEDKDVRLILVDLLSQIPGRKSSQALAQRSLYDLHPAVREKALAALKDRACNEYEEIYIEAFRHPWEPVADHAAEALVALRFGHMVERLIPLLEDPDPRRLAKVEENKRTRYEMRELVRVNHLSNCILCHAASSGPGDFVRGAIPVPGEPLPPPVQYYQKPGSSFVRADVTFLRQDFSVCQPMTNPGKWPSQQRYDYMLRRVPIDNLQAGLMLQGQKGQRNTFPQREALLFALRELTGKDLGTTFEEWKMLAKPAEPRTKEAPEDGRQKVAQLADALVKATPAQMADLLDKYAKSDDPAYDTVLTRALSQFSGDVQKQVRQALVERLVRLPVEKLRAKLGEMDEGMQLAAILACGRAGAKALVPDLVPFVEHRDSEIVWSTRRILQELTGQDFGPSLNAGPQVRAEAVAQWRAWLKRQNAK